MKTLLYTLFLSFFCTCAFAQKIAGKWRCAEESVGQMHIGFDDVSCTYRFKRNGTMIIRIKGSTYVSHGEFTSTRDHHQSGTIEIKGTYIVKDEKITTYIDRKDIEAYALEYSNHDEENSLYRAENIYADIKAKEIRAQIIHKPEFWNWNNEPITITKKELIIGDKLRCKR